jgi:hypothetical protein
VQANRRHQYAAVGDGAVLAIQPAAALATKRDADSKKPENRKSAARKFRNHMRDMQFVFKGTPSTSPYCSWVNEPESRRSCRRTDSR